jgi:hypothetical protein
LEQLPALHFAHVEARLQNNWGQQKEKKKLGIELENMLMFFVSIFRLVGSVFLQYQSSYDPNDQTCSGLGEPVDFFNVQELANQQSEH